MSDDEVIERVRRGETGLYTILIVRHQQRLQAMLYPILRNDTEVEDAMQAGHLHALAHLGQFAGRSSFLTWMTRIMIHEALGILRRRRRLEQLDALTESGGLTPVSRGRNPEQEALNRELRAALVRALEMLPKPYRAVFTMRELDEMSTADAAGALGISEECVRIRLYRARMLLQRRLARRGPAHTHRARAVEVVDFIERKAVASRRIPSRISLAPTPV